MRAAGRRLHRRRRQHRRGGLHGDQADGGGGGSRPRGRTGRVRVNIISRLGVEEGSTEFIALDGVELYQGGKCVRLAATATPALGTLETDMGGLLAEGAVDPGQITHVTLLPASGTEGRLRLRGEK